jgi:DNA-directed RNA polymerase specialized sigma24 family protein
VPPAGSITHWIVLLKAGEAAAAQELWERYFRQLVRLARGKLQGRAQAVLSGEDIALSAFDSFCRGAEQGRFPQLRDRSDLWQLLVVITARKTIDALEYESRKKRTPPRQATQGPPNLEEVIGREPSPEFAAQMADECEALLARLDDPELRTVAVWKMEGYTNEEIAARLGCVPRTVERKVRVIRSIWGAKGPGREPRDPVGE